MVTLRRQNFLLTSVVGERLFSDLHGSKLFSIFFLITDRKRFNMPPFWNIYCMVKGEGENIWQKVDFMKVRIFIYWITMHWQLSFKAANEEKKKINKGNCTHMITFSIRFYKISAHFFETDTSIFAVVSTFCLFLNSCFFFSPKRKVV